MKMKINQTTEPARVIEPAEVEERTDLDSEQDMIIIASDGWMHNLCDINIAYTPSTGEIEAYLKSSADPEGYKLVSGLTPLAVDTLKEELESAIKRGEAVFDFQDYIDSTFEVEEEKS